MKPTCQNGDEKYWLQVQMQHGIPWNSGKPAKPRLKRKEPKSMLKSKLVKEAEKLFPLSSTPDDPIKAKTPYGVMKSMVPIKDNSNLFPAPKIRDELSSKAPSDTPNPISLTNTDRNKASNDQFLISQDMFPSNSGPPSRSPTTQSPVKPASR
uniref:Uncharacterized protein n=1 Tax=Ciona savignyi TaxID=51511 RepID=H2ZKE0_CIOSA